MERIRQEIEELRRVASYDHGETDATAVDQHVSPAIHQSHPNATETRFSPGVDKSHKSSLAATSICSPKLNAIDSEESYVTRHSKFASPVGVTWKNADVEREPTGRYSNMCNLVLPTELIEKHRRISGYGNKNAGRVDSHFLGKSSELAEASGHRKDGTPWDTYRIEEHDREEENSILSRCPDPVEEPHIDLYCRKLKENEYGMIQQSAEISSLKVQVATAAIVLLHEHLASCKKAARDETRERKTSTFALLSGAGKTSKKYCHDTKPQQNTAPRHVDKALRMLTRQMTDRIQADAADAEFDEHLKQNDAEKI
eukprot:595027-Hanusia_phi.AAC.4